MERSLNVCGFLRTCRRTEHAIHNLLENLKYFFNMLLYLDDTVAADVSLTFTLLAVSFV